MAFEVRDAFSRTALLIGAEGLERLARARVAVFGLGGVGGWAAEALARSGVGALDLVDDDRIAPSNVNRQIFALTSTVGQYKADAAQARILDINPEAQVRAVKVFFGVQNAGEFDFSQYDYVVDSIDTVTRKIQLIQQAQAVGTPIISSMGTGNKLDPTMLQVADIYETSVCPLARIMRKELRRRGVKALKVVYSREEPIVPCGEVPQEDEPERDGAPSRRATPGSCSFVPPAAGLIIAGEVVRDLIGISR